MKKWELLSKTVLTLLLVVNLVNLSGQNEHRATRGFIENKGQIHDQNLKANAAVRYLMPAANGLSVQLKSTGFSYDTYTMEKAIAKSSPANPLQKPALEEVTYKYHRIDIEFMGANPNPKCIASGMQGEVLNFYNSASPENEIRNVAAYDKVTYYDIYPGIDVEFIAKSGTSKPVEYNFIVHKNGNIRQIQLKYKGAISSKLIDSKLVFETSNGNLTENIPASWIQETKAKQAVAYQVISPQNEEFVIGFKQTGKSGEGTLVIDPTPVLEWGTYCGDNSNDISYGISSDYQGNYYVTGRTLGGASLATAGAYQTTNAGGYDAFLVKYDAAGVRQWSTYFGGANLDFGTSVAADLLGGVSIVGKTTSTGIASVGAQQTTFTGAAAIFLARFNSSNGTRYWSRYYSGGSDPDANSFLPAIAYSNTLPGSLYITGITYSTTDVATVGAQQTTYGDYGDAFIAKISLTGNLVWGTYYGTSNNIDGGLDIALDLKQNVIVVGQTGSTGLSTVGSHQATYGGGTDGFVVKLDSNGVRKWGTYYGGTGYDYTLGVATNSKKEIFITGPTFSTSGISTPGSHQLSSGGSLDSYLVKFDSNGVRKWGTYYGGSGDDMGTAITWSCGDDIIMGGLTSSSTGVATSNAYSTTLKGDLDAMIVRFDSAGTRQWGTYYGGTGRDFPYDLTINPTNNKILLCGETASSTGIATSTGTDTIFGGNGQADGFIAQFNNIDISGSTTVCENTTLNLTAQIATTASPISYAWSGPNNVSGTNSALSVTSIPLTGSGIYSLTITAKGCTYTTSDSIKVLPAPTAVIQGDSAICTGDTLHLSATGGSSYVWSGPSLFSANSDHILLPNATPSTTGAYTVTVTGSNTCTSTASKSIVVNERPTPLISSNSPLCAFDTLKLTSAGGVSYIWSGPNTYTSTNQNPLIPTQDTTLSGNYAVMVTNISGCTATASTSVLVNPNSKPLLSANAPLCTGDTLKLFSSNGSFYSWSGPNSYSSDLQNLSIGHSDTTLSGIYKMSLTNAFGCTNKDSIDILVWSNPVLTHSNDTTICLYQGLTISVSGADSYLWNNGNNTDSYLTYPTMDTTYGVIGTDLRGCKSMDSVNIKVLPFIEVSLSQTPGGVLLKDQTARYEALPAGYTNYNFYLNGAIVQSSSSNSYTPTSIKTSDTITIITTSPNLCFSTPGLGIHVIDIYNSFSPNNDGANDLFMQGYNITIYNRWGAVLYEGVNGWDGKFNGAEQNTGTYYFTIKYDSLDQEVIEYKGSLMLIR